MLQLNILNEPGRILDIDVDSKTTRDLMWLKSQILIASPDIADVQMYWGSTLLRSEKQNRTLDFFDLYNDRPLRILLNQKPQPTGSIISFCGHEITVTDSTTVQDLVEIAKRYPKVYIPDDIHVAELRWNPPARLDCEKTVMVHDLSMTLASLGIPEFSNLSAGFYSEEDGKIRILIKTLQGRSFPFLLSQFTKISDVKILLRQKEGTHEYMQRLIFAGSLLQDDLTLWNYGIGEDAVFHMVLIQIGGVGGPSFVDMSDSRAIQHYAFSNFAPSWRHVSRGLNVEGKCTKKGCKAYRKQVICPIGMGDFDLILDSDKVKCPACAQTVKPITCGLYACYYRYKGIKLERGTRKPIHAAASTWLRARDEDYTYYNPDKRTVGWARLVISTQQCDPDQECLLCSATRRDVSTCGELKQATCCENRFHTECFSAWNKLNAKCPACRSDRIELQPIESNNKIETPVQMVAN